MTKTYYMGNDGDSSTIDLDVGIIGGPGVTVRYDENGNASSPTDQVGIIGHTYITSTMANQAALVGDSFNDVLKGSGGDDFIVWEYSASGLGGPRYFLPSGGTAAIDVFDLGAGSDILNLTFINDHNPLTTDIAYTDKALVFGGTGSDVIWSGNGNDELYGGPDSAGDTIYGGGGNDTIAGSLGVNQLSGDSGNDTIFGGSNFDGIGGGDGDDTIFGGASADGISGDAGNDTIFGGFESDSSIGDNIDAGSGDDTVYGGQGKDDIAGGQGDRDVLFGDSGNDNIGDFDGAIQTYGGAGDDFVQVIFGPTWSGGTATVSGDGGNDVLVLSSQNAATNMIVTGDFATATVSDGNDTILMSGSYNAMAVTMGGGDDRYVWSQAVGASGNQIDTVFGGDGNDTIVTGNGNDFLQGDAGDDSFYGGAGADSFVGGTGTDLISYSTAGGGVTMGLNGSTGVGSDAQGDVSATDVENLTGSNFADSLAGNAAGNVIQGLDGNDTIEGLAGADSLFGGTGIDMVAYTNSSLAVNVTLGGSTGVGGDAQGDLVSADFENLSGSAFNDTLTGSGIDNAIFGQGGNDTVQGGAGTDSLFGGAGNDLLLYSADGAVDGLNGDDSLVLYTGDNFTSNLVITLGAAATFSSDTYDGGANTDTVLLTGGNDVYVANTNDLTVDGVVGTAHAGQVVGIEVLDAGAGDDVVALNDAAASGGTAYGNAITVGGGDGNDIVATGSGNDLVYGDRLGESATATGGNDTLFSGAGNDTVFGNAGDDLVFGSSGSDSLFGGQGNDTLSYAQSDAAVNATLSGTGTGGYAQGDVIGTDFENLVGSTFNDRLVGDANGNAIFGIGGIDTILGNGGADTLYGGDGTDTLYGGSGSDVDSLYGDGGDDLIVANVETLSSAGEAVVGWDGNGGFGSANATTVALTAGSQVVLDFVDGGDGTDLLDLRQLGGGSGARNVLSFSLGSDLFQNLYGVEQIVAAGAADVINLTYEVAGQGHAYTDNVTIVAGENSDVVFSGSGHDLVYGDNATSTVGELPGADTLFGGAGNDTIFGDSPNGLVGGDDTIFGGFGDDTLYGGAGNDTIGDSSDGTIFGGVGDDVIAIRFTDNIAAGLIDGGPGTGVDGDDRVFVSGFYDHNNVSLGLGNDTYIATVIDEPGDEGTTANRVDVVDGGAGNDVISTFWGNDTLFGGSGEDALWGGAGADTIYGGPDTDYIYPGSSDTNTGNNVMYGGGGEDYYYVSRTDGPLNQIYDLARAGQAADGTGNYLVVIGESDSNESGPGADFLLNGSGVFETDHDITNGAGMVQVTSQGGHLWQLTMIGGDGSGLGVNSTSIVFDDRDVNGIALWNNDAVPGEQVIQFYQWTGSSYVFVP